MTCSFIRQPPFEVGDEAKHMTQYFHKKERGTSDDLFLERPLTTLQKTFSILNTTTEGALHILQGNTLISMLSTISLMFAIWYRNHKAKEHFPPEEKENKVMLRRRSDAINYNPITAE